MLVDDDASFDLGMVGSDGKITSAWTGNLPHLMPTAANVHAGTLYAGGRLHYHEGKVFVGVAALPIGGTTGTVVGCSAVELLSGVQWPSVFATAADDDFVYALVSQTASGNIQYAIARFPQH